MAGAPSEAAGVRGQEKGQVSRVRNLITDVEGLRVGNASDPDLKSGVTVLTADQPFAASAHVMGGAPGTREFALLAPDKLVDRIDAIVLSGGSAFGLDAAGGVATELRRLGRGFPAAGFHVPIVPAAILFDLANGGNKGWEDNPYPALGARAFRAAAADFALGSAGAGVGAHAGPYKGGLGSSSARLATGEAVGALVAVNSLGSVVVPGTRQFWAAPFEQGSEFGGLGVAQTTAIDAERLNGSDRLSPGAKGIAQGNTTIAVIATDARVDKSGLQRLAVSAHDGIARAIVPAHTPFDGDLIFAIATAMRGPVTDRALLGHAAGICLARAIARAIYAARPQKGDMLPCWSDAQEGHTPRSDAMPLNPEKNRKSPAPAGPIPHQLP